MKEPFMYFALNDPFDLIDISEKCKVDSQTHIIQDEGWKMMTVTIFLQFSYKSEVKSNVMSLHVSLRWTRGVSVCCRGSFSILLSENNLLLFLNEAKNIRDIFLTTSLWLQQALSFMCGVCISRTSVPKVVKEHTIFYYSLTTHIH